MKDKRLKNDIPLSKFPCSTRIRLAGLHRNCGFHWLQTTLKEYPMECIYLSAKKPRFVRGIRVHTSSIQPNVLQGCGSKYALIDSLQASCSFPSAAFLQVWLINVMLSPIYHLAGLVGKTVRFQQKRANPILEAYDREAGSLPHREVGLKTCWVSL